MPTSVSVDEVNRVHTGLALRCFAVRAAGGNGRAVSLRPSLSTDQEQHL